MVANSVDYVGYAYAGTVAAGGIFGYIKRQSVPSLIAGLAFGLLCGVGAWSISTQNNHTIMLASSTILGAIMGLRFYKSRKVMPAGLVAGLSTLIALRSLYAMSA